MGSIHTKQLSNGSKAGRLLGSSCLAQAAEVKEGSLVAVVKRWDKKEKGRGPFVKGFSLTPMLFA